jgi:hypothetical protein
VVRELVESIPIEAGRGAAAGPREVRPSPAG